VSAPLHIPSLGGATGWLNSEPPGPAELRGRVVARELRVRVRVAEVDDCWLLQEVTTRLPGREWED
jgi:hypothetical protein